MTMQTQLQDLRKVLIDELDQLRKGKIKHQRATAVARLGATVIAAIQLELSESVQANSLVSLKRA